MGADDDHIQEILRTNNARRTSFGNRDRTLARTDWKKEKWTEQMDTWHEKMAPFSPNKNNFHAFDRRRSHANVSCMHPYRWNCRYWLSDVLVVMFIVKLKIGQPMSKMTQYTFIPSRLTITSNNYANLRLDPQYWRSQHSDSSLAWRGKRIELAVVWITTTCLRSRQSIMKKGSAGSVFLNMFANVSV